MSDESIRKTILIVDDQPHVRRLLRNILTRDGYNVLEAEDGSTAVETLRAHGADVDLALVDVELPGPGGREVAETIIRFGVTQTLFITGLDRDALIAEGRLERAAPFVLKPFTIATVTGAVKAVLGPRLQLAL